MSIFKNRMDSQERSYTLSPLVKEFIPKALGLSSQGRENATHQGRPCSNSPTADFQHVAVGEQNTNGYKRVENFNNRGRGRGNWRGKNNERFDASSNSHLTPRAEFNGTSDLKGRRLNCRRNDNSSQEARLASKSSAHSQHYKTNRQTSSRDIAVNSKMQLGQNSSGVDSYPNIGNPNRVQNGSYKSERQLLNSSVPESPDCDGWIEVRSKNRRDEKEKSRHVKAVTNSKVQMEKLIVPESEVLSQKMNNMSISKTTENLRMTEKPNVTFNDHKAPINAESATASKSDISTEVEKKKKKRTNSQRKEEYRSKLKRLPATHGKVFTVSSDVFQYLNKGEQIPKILRHSDVDDDVTISIKKEDFPLLGQDCVEVFVDDNDSGWSDIEGSDLHNANTVKPNEDFPELGAAHSASSSNSRPLHYSELFKKAALSRNGELEYNVSPAAKKLCKASKTAKQITNDKKSSAASASSKPKFNSLIKLDIVNMLNKQQETSLMKQSTGNKEKKTKMTKKVVANMLDSTAPLRRRGKEREIPREKKPSTMKKIILKERQDRRLARSSPAIAQENELVQSQLENHSSQNSDSAEANDSGNEKKDEINITIEVFSVTNDNLIRDEENAVTEVSAVINGSEKPPIDLMNRIQHSRRFREYCHQNLSPEIDEVATKLIQDLIRFHDKVFQKDPIKAKMRRRIVVGLREITKHLKLKKLKCLILAPNVERISNEGGLDDAIGNIISLAEEMNVPVVFALGRRKLGFVCLKKVPISGIGIFNYDGSEENYKKLIELADKERNSYFEKQTAVLVN